MKKYKIGRYYYQEITEEQYEKMYSSENRRYIVSLVDYDGEPIKFFKKEKTENDRTNKV